VGKVNDGSHPRFQAEPEYGMIFDKVCCNVVDNLSETILFRDFIRSTISRRGDA
jgi:hypothetical protein